MKRFGGAMLVFLLLLCFGGVFSAAASADNYIIFKDVSGSCDGQLITINFTLEANIRAGSTLKLTQTVIDQGQPQSFSIEMVVPQDMKLGDSVSTFLPAGMIIEISYELYNPDGSFASSTTLHAECGNVWGGYNQGVPGCDAYVALPTDAVVGEFVADAPVYWEPGELANPALTITAGKTLWVAGQDATGMFRKVLLSCDWIWVEADKVGPNYDAVWNGQPLPSTVVE